jgi:tRNA (mo5U34)-methyltransferase
MNAQALDRGNGNNRPTPEDFMKHCSPQCHLSREEIQERVRSLGEWFHNLDLMGVQTAPHHFLGDYPAIKWRRFAQAFPSDLHGKSVLDIGCNAGFYSMEMKRRGAERVLGIDHDERYLAQARFASQVNGLDIEYTRMSVYETAALRERFDIVLFMGVFYHLRYPLLALDLLYEHVVRDTFVFQSMLRGSREVRPMEGDYPFSEELIFNEPTFPKLHFIEKRYTGDPTNWWIPNRACVEAMLRSAGFGILGNPEAEVYMCRRLESKDEFSRLPSGGIDCG